MTINLNDMISLVANNDPRRVYQELLENDDEFRGFIDKYKDKNTEEMIECFDLAAKIRVTYSHAS